MVRLLIFWVIFIGCGEQKGLYRVDDNYVMKDSLFVKEVGKYPVFEGDIESFIRDNIKYPLQALMDSIEGIVLVELRVDTLGKTFGHQVVWGKHVVLNQEALRVSRLISFKEPAMHGNNPFEMSFVIPVEFHLGKPGSNDLITALENFPVHKKSLSKMIYANLKYPLAAIRDRVEGTVWVQFIVDTNCVVKAHRVIKGIRFDVDQEALRVTRLIRFQKPAIQKGKPVSILYTYPVKFKLPRENVGKKMKNSKKL